MNWTIEENNIIKELYPESSKELILSKINRSWKNIITQACKLGIKRIKRSDSFTLKEEQLLKEIFEHNTKKHIIEKFKEAGFKRSAASIFLNARRLGLKRDPEFIKQDMVEGGKNAPTPLNIILWTEKDDNKLLSIYPNGNQEEIMATFPGRTWKAIREHTIRLGLSRSKEKIDEDRAKHLKENLGVTSTWQLEKVKEKSRQTNLEKRGVEYALQSPEVRTLIKKTVQKEYGVDNVFQSEEIKERIKETNLKNLGVENPNQSPITRAQTETTNLKYYGVKNQFQRTEKIQEGMLKKHGDICPLRVPKIKAQQQATNIKRYGFPTPCQNPEIKKNLIEKLNTDEVKEKKYNSLKEKDNFSASGEENDFYLLLQKIYPDVEHHKLHPISKSILDYFFPSLNLWGQYDGSYWHGMTNRVCEGPQRESIKKTIIRDKIQNKTIPNLIRFYSEDVKKAINSNVDNYIKEMVEDKIEELKENPIAHQYKKRIQYYKEDIDQLPFNPEIIKASDFDLTIENLSNEIVSFIERYEWLGTIGVSPKWCFTARFKGFLGGVVLINEPVAYSKILGNDTPKYEALIQRGASISWAPKNLGSRLIMYSCRWMVNNTEKRAFVGYADINADEKGIIYRACNFEYLGADFGVSELLKHPSIPRLFTSHYLKRTSAFIRWCRDNKITPEKTWFKENRFKNLETIPSEIKKDWYDWIKKIISESEKIKIEKKMKYILILGKNKRETKYLRSVQNYVSEPYPQNTKKANQQIQNLQFGLGKTQNRRNDAKDQFIIDNYGKMTKNEIATTLGEAPRWIKRCIALLKKQNKIIPTKPSKSKNELLNEEKWLPEIKNRAISLRRDLLKDKEEISNLLKTEFGFIVSPSALGSWFNKFNCPFPSKENWLKRFLSPDIIKGLLEKSYRRKDIVDYIKNTYGVYISEDIVSLYIRSLPIN